MGRGIRFLTVIAVEVVRNRSRVETYAWMAVVLVPWLAAISALGKRVKCPRCQKNLYKELAAVRSPTALTSVTLARAAELGVTERTDCCQSRQTPSSPGSWQRSHCRMRETPPVGGASTQSQRTYN